MSYVEFPRYAISITLEDKFIDGIINIFKSNKKYFENYQSIIEKELLLNIKPPFYKTNLYDEKEIISIFLNLKNEIEITDIVNFKNISFRLEKKDHYLKIILKVDNELDYFFSQIIRRYDEFRKVLNIKQYEMDIGRFKKLTERQTMYYQIWGHPYIFEEIEHHIKLLNLNNLNNNEIISFEEKFKKMLNYFNSIDLKYIGLYKQINQKSNFKCISKLNL